MRHPVWHIALGLAIQRLRLERALSQEAMCLKTGLSRNHASELENGKVSPTFDTLLKLTELFAIQPSALMHEVEKELSNVTVAR